MANPRTIETKTTFDNSNPGVFSSWSLTIHNMILSCGIVTVPTTNDLTFLGFAQSGSPGITQDYFGYRVYAFADSLQGSGAPVFFRIDYGSGASNGNNPMLIITVGTSHVDGLVASHAFAWPHSGTVQNSPSSSAGFGGYNTGSLGATWWTGSASLPPTAMMSSIGMYCVSDTTARSASISGDTSWFTLALMFEAGISQNGLIISLERTKDGNGNDDKRGVLLNILGNNSSQVTSPLFALSFGSGTTGQQVNTPRNSQFSSEPIVRGSRNPSAYSSSIGLGEIAMVAPFAFLKAGFSGQEQGLGMLLLESDDVKNIPIASASMGADIFVPIRGQWHSYRVLPGPPLTNVIDGTNTKVAIRFEGRSGL